MAKKPRKRSVFDAPGSDPLAFDDALSVSGSASSPQAKQPAKPAAKPPVKPTAKTPEVPGKVVKSGINSTINPPVVPNLSDRQTRELGAGATPKNKKILQAHQELWDGVGRVRAVDQFMGGFADDQRRRTGSATVFVSDEPMFIGIPMSALPLEYLMQMDSFPLSNLVQVSGPPSSGKTAMVFEFLRFFVQAGGGGHFFDAELKLSETWYKGFLAEDCRRRITVDRPTTLEAWQQLVTRYQAYHKKAMIGTAESPGPGRTIPILFALDSWNARASQETHDKIMEDGYGGRGHPIEALSVTRFLKSMWGEFDRWPFSFVVVNHTVPSLSDSGPDTREPGGEFLKFQQTFHMVCNTAGNINTAEFKGFKVKLRLKKSGYGETDRFCFTRVIWHYVDEVQADGSVVPKQQVKWDWDWSICDLLANLGHGLKQPLFANRLKTYDIDVRVKSPEAPVGAMFNSRALGLGKEEYIPYTDAGKMIHANHEFCNRLRLALAINRRPVLAGQYLEQ